VNLPFTGKTLPVKRGDPAIYKDTVLCQLQALLCQLPTTLKDDSAGYIDNSANYIDCSEKL
jgi:hypothetical protein